jgi:tetratricopeptide (TPR) repeat protein
MLAESISSGNLLSRRIVGSKKLILIVLAILMAGSGGVSAQKKNVSIAKAKLLSEVPDTKGAKEAILPALKDSITSRDATTWFTAGEVFNAIYEENQKLFWTLKKEDENRKKAAQTTMGESIKQALDYYIVADSLDRLPDKKGKVKPKYTKKIVDRTLGFRRSFIDAGSFFYGEKQYEKALEMFSIYLKYPELPFLKDKKQELEKDTLVTRIKYYCGLCATQANKPEIAVTYYEQVKDSIDSEWIYARLCEDYIILKDTSNLLRILQLGAQKFPNEPYYTRNLINYYINTNQMDAAMDWIDKAIAQDAKNAPLWNVKGRMLENKSQFDEAIKCYEKAIELDPKFADALGNIGRIYYNEAVEELNRVNSIKDDREYRREKEKLKTKFAKAQPYFEKAHEIDPTERDYIIALRGIYYNLGMNDLYQKMDNLLK